MNSRKQIKAKASGYALIAFRDNLSCQIFNIADINGPRRKVTGASIKVDVNGVSIRGTIIRVADQKKCLQIEKEKLNVKAFFGIPNRKKVVARTVIPVAVSTNPHFTRSSAKRKLKSLKDQKSVNIQRSNDSKTINLQQKLNTDNTCKTQHLTLVKHETNEVSFRDLSVSTPVSDCLSSTPSSLTNKSPPTFEVPITVLESSTPSSNALVAQCFPIVNDVILPAYTPVPKFISPIPYVEHSYPITPSIPSPLYTSSPLKTDCVHVAKTSFSSPLDAYRTLGSFSPPIVDPSTPSYLTLETPTTTPEPLAKSLIAPSFLSNFDSPVFIDQPTPDDLIHSSSNCVDLTSSSMSLFEPLLISPPNDPRMQENTTYEDKSIHPKLYQHTKSMNHNISFMSGIEPLIQSFSEYPTPNHSFVDPERDPITNQLLISGPNKKRVDRARYPYVSKARRNLPFTATNPYHNEMKSSSDNSQLIPIELTGCSNNRKMSEYSEDIPILNWLCTTPPPIQWMHEELLESEEQRIEVTSGNNAPLSSPGCCYTLPHEDKVKLFADEGLASSSINTLSPIVTASINSMTSQTLAQSASNNNRIYNDSRPYTEILPNKTNHLKISLQALSGNTTYPEQQIHKGALPTHPSILTTVSQINNYEPFTQASAKLVPSQPPSHVNLAHTQRLTTQQPSYPPTSEFPCEQSFTYSHNMAGLYSQSPQFQLGTPVPPVQCFTTPIFGSPSYIPPQIFNAPPNFYNHIPFTPNVHTSPAFDVTPPTPSQIFQLSITTPNLQQSDTKSIIESCSRAKESYLKGQDSPLVSAVSQSTSHAQKKHKTLYQKRESASTSIYQASQLNTHTIISRPSPCLTPLPHPDPYIKTNVKVFQKSAKDLKAMRQLKYFDIDDPKLLLLKATHIAKRNITSFYVQQALDDLPDDASEEPISHPYMIDTSVLREALSTSSASPQHFARFLFDKIFTVYEFRGHSIRGAGERRILNQIKMASIKVAVCTIFPMENNDWQRCESSINCHIRALERKMKRLTWLKFDKYQS